MPDLVRLDVGVVKRQIRLLLHAYPDVAGAVLFGSALEFCRSDSDIDVGIIRSRALDPDADAWADLGFAEEVADSLGKIGEHSFHVTVLSLRMPFLAFTAMHTGRPVYVRDEELVTDFLEEIALRYRDDYPRYRTALQEINS